MWPVAGAQVGEIDATLLTFKIRSERLVWGKQSGAPAVSGRPIADLRERLVPVRPRLGSSEVKPSSAHRLVQGTMPSKREAQ